MASEAPTTSTISPYLQGVETETFLTLSKMSEQKESLKNMALYHNLVISSIFCILNQPIFNYISFPLSSIVQSMPHPTMELNNCRQCPF